MRKISERQVAERRAREWVALDNVRLAVGSKTALARALGISYQAVQHWYNNGVPVERCAALETLTHGTVQCEQLREDYRSLTERPYRLLKAIYRAGDKPCVYLSGPMTGCPELNFPAFHVEAARLRAAGLDVVSPAEVKLEGKPGWADYMRADIRQMMRCSAICMLPGWESSRGAKIEHDLALALGFELMLAGDGV